MIRRLGQFFSYMLIIIPFYSFASPQNSPSTCLPSLKRLYRKALAHHELSLKRIRSLQSRMRWSALIPKLSIRGGGSAGQGLYYVENTENISERDGRTTRFVNWDIRANWDLSRLVFDTKEIALERMRQRTFKLRHLLFKQIARLYQILETAQSPEERQSAYRELNMLSGDAISAKRFKCLEQSALKTSKPKKDKLRL